MLPYIQNIYTLYLYINKAKVQKIGLSLLEPFLLKIKKFGILHCVIGVNQRDAKITRT